MGQPLVVPYEAPQGRRLNVIGGYFSHGPLAGKFEFASFASLPQRRSKQPRKTVAEQAAEHGLAEEEVGVLDAEVFLAFVWLLSGRPVDAPEGWRRERPLVVVVDNYQVHKSERVKLELPELNAADVYLCYLPAYCPEMSRIEPVWHDVKYHGLPQRSYDELGKFKRAVDLALLEKRQELRAAAQESAQLLCLPP